MLTACPARMTHCDWAFVKCREPQSSQVHILELSEGISAPLNDALWRDIHKVRASEDGLIISNRGGGFHSTQHLFQRCVARKSPGCPGARLCSPHL